jgi:hypothetical protein
MDQSDNWKLKALLLGTVIGAVTGLLASLILVQRAEKSQQKPELTAGDGVKLGMGVLGVLRMISDFGSPKTDIIKK